MKKRSKPSSKTFGERDIRPRGKTPAERMEIVFEDDDIIVVDKPHGLLTATPEGGQDPGVFELLKKRAGPRRRDEPQRVWIIHRLDREASGLLVFAKTEAAFHWLKEDLKSRRITRRYWALVENEFEKPETLSDWKVVQSFLIDNERGVVRSTKEKPYRPTADDSARELAVTNWRLLAQGKGLALVELKLDTGRRHQIRVHMADIGHPLSGDERYGARANPLHRLGLHAAELSFRHPRTAAAVSFRSDAGGKFHRALGLDAPKEDAVTGVGTTPTSKKQRAGKAERAQRAERSERMDRIDTSWNDVGEWYEAMLDGAGGALHEEIILPGAMRLARIEKDQRCLDVACGEGRLARRMAESGARVVGIDAARSLIAAAKKKSPKSIRFVEMDAHDLERLDERPFDCVTCVMALMNIDPLEPVFKKIAGLLTTEGAFVAVILHPSFADPKQSRWCTDATGDRPVLYRRVDGYLSQGAHEIVMNPGDAARGADRVVTFTFHRPLQAYVQALASAGFAIDWIEEWAGRRPHSTQRSSSEETRARLEIPLFLGIRARKVASRNDAGDDRGKR